MFGLLALCVVLELRRKALPAALLLSGCVRSVTTCVTYDHALGRSDAYPRDGAGASVCAEVGPRD